MLQIQAGNIPNIAIFNDGAADIYTGYQSGRSGAVHLDFEKTAARMEQRDLPPWPLAIQAVESSAVFRLVNSQMSKLSASPLQSANVVTYETMKVDRMALANAITETYLSNYRVVDALARSGGFTYYFFWPAHLSNGKKALTQEERDLKGAVDPALQRLFDAVYEIAETYVGREEYRNLFSLTDVFDERESLIWLDDAHTTQVGNQLIAERMLRVISGRETLAIEHTSHY
jgi:hypothetical protein